MTHANNDERTANLDAAFSADLDDLELDEQLADEERDELEALCHFLDRVR